jgi:hypothetical protein
MEIGVLLEQCIGRHIKDKTTTINHGSCGGVIVQQAQELSRWHSDRVSHAVQEITQT